jgi:ribose 1,5-bisphosphokinase
MTTPERPGRLAYVMGPSGAGKDTLMAYARARVDSRAIVFARRYITRPSEAGGENHVALTAAEFAARRDAGLFALYWESHGLSYGIGAEIALWLERGLIVVVSGSRAAWPQAKALYPGLLGIVVDAPVELRAKRLALRSREDEPAIRARLAREVALPADDALHWLDNSGSIEAAGETLVALLQQHIS